MKKIIILAFILMSIISCKSTDNNESSLEQENIISSENETVEKDIDIDSSKQEEIIKPEITDYSKDINEYTDLYNKYEILLKSDPKFVTKGSSIKTPYIINVINKENQMPVPDFPLIIKTPYEKDENGNLIFDSVNKRTDLQGKLEFYPTPSKIAFDSYIQINFEPKNTDSEFLKQLDNILDEKSFKFPYKVKSNLCTKGGSIALVDFTKEGKPISNNSLSSSSLLIALYQKGFSNVGNSPDIINEIISGDTTTVYKASKKLSPRNYYLTYGTVKIGNSTKNEDNTFSVKLDVDITSLDMQNNKIFFKSNFTIEKNGKTENDAIGNARKEMANKISELMLYGM